MRISAAIILVVLSMGANVATQSSPSIPEITVDQLIGRLNVVTGYDLCHYTKREKKTAWCFGSHLYKNTWYVIVDDVTEYAILDHYIVGTAQGSFFVLDTTNDGLNRRASTVYPDAPSWKRAVSALGFSIPKLQDPSQVKNVTKPREPSQPIWAVAAFVLALVLSIGFGGIVENLWKLVGLSVAVGMIAGLIGDALVFEGAGLGIIGQPICCVVAALISRGLAIRKLNPIQRL